MDTLLPQPGLEPRIANEGRRGGQRQIHPPPLLGLASCTAKETTVPLIGLGFLVLPEDAGQVCSLPVIESSPDLLEQLAVVPPFRLGQDWNSITGPGASPRIYDDPLRHPVHLRHEANQPTSPLRGYPFTASHYVAALQFTQLAPLRTKPCGPTLEPDRPTCLLRAQTRIMPQVLQRLRSPLAPEQLLRITAKSLS
ncbi:hypothetical protein [Streptomyces sp. NPDC056061]|uniref:hypothetical protein n=1 Tax=Streptomyces sp. NPDC056061 TaxID=3345700 RepID=UPI0035DF0EBD